MLKRFLAGVLSISMLVIPSQMVSAKDTNTEISEKAMNVIKKLDVIPSLESKDLNMEVTRAEMALAIARMIKFDDTQNSPQRYFTDVAMEHWAQSAINHLAEIGVISQAPDKLFRPDNKVSLNEAVKMVTALAGYNSYAQVNGGYPNGYLAVAYDHDLLDGINTDERFTLGEALVLLVNAFEMDIYGVSGTSGGYPVYDEVDETLFERYHDIYTAKGRVIAAYGISLDSNVSVMENQVMIDDTVYYTTEDLSGFIANNVSIYYRDDKPDSKEPEIIYCYAPEKDNDAITVLAKDFSDIKNGIFSYYENGGSKLKSEKIAADALVIKNGMRVIKDISKAYNVESGQYRLVDTDKDGMYDVVLISDARIFLVQNVDVEREIIYGETYDGEKTIFEISDRKYSFTKNGISVGLDSIEPGSVINIYESASFISGVITNNTFTGKIEAILDESFVIDGEEKDIYPTAFKAIKNNIQVGTDYQFSPDRYGSIAFVKSNDKKSVDVGYLVEVKKIGELEDEFKLQYKIFTLEGKMVKLQSDPEKTYVDEIRRKTGEEVIEALTEAGGGSADQLISYKLNSDGLVVKIDTQKKTEAETEASMSKIYESTGRVTYNGNNKKFDRSGVYTGGTMFLLPSKESITEAADDEFSLNPPLGNGTVFDGGGAVYSTNQNDLSKTIAVMYRKGASVSAHPYLVSDKARTVYDEKSGDVLKTISLFGPTETEYSISPNYVEEFESLNLKAGDVIQIATNAQEQISGVTVMLNYGEQDVPDGMVAKESYAFNQDDLSGGKALRRSGTIYEWSYKNEETAYERYNLADSYQVAVFDPSLPSGFNVYTGTMAADVLTADYVGMDNASSILVFSQTGNLRRIIVHKNGWKK